MINTFRYSAHKFICKNNLTFSAIEYSKFKYGSKKFSQKLGIELATYFFGSIEFKQVYKDFFKRNLVVCSAPWKNIPVASTALKDYFLDELNLRYIKSSFSVEDLKVYRGHSYNQDYGSMTREERDTAITSDDFDINKDIIEGKVLLFIDDIFITGAHERRILSLLKKVGFKGCVLFLYYAEYQGENNPSVENELNYAFVKNVSDVDYIIKNEELIFNTRLVKFLLNSRDFEFKDFIFNQSHSFCLLLKEKIESNDYNEISEFKKNYGQLNYFLKSS